MKRALALLTALLILTTPSTWAAVVIDKYAWEFPLVSGVGGADDLIADLQTYVQKILDAGHLAPIYISYSDQASVGYKVYQEPGRIITTLAWAYPYLTPTQKAAVKTYVAAELADSRFAPWGSYPMPDNVGTPRELHSKTKWWSETNNFVNRPSVQTIYGLWLYAHRTGDWTLVQNNWTSIKSVYSSRSAEGKLYGTMCAHIAMARLADKFNDSATRTTALNNLQTQLDAGLNFTTIENNAISGGGSSMYSCLPDMYDSRMNGTTYRGWIFLNMSPEIGRYIAGENAALKTAVLTRHSDGLATFPDWWVNKANYFCRSWTGDEGTGLVPDVFGMFAPIERWVTQSSAAALRKEMLSAPTGLGDCYWLEALVQAIEATGTITWTDVRNQVVNTAPPAAPKNLRLR